MRDKLRFLACIFHEVLLFSPSTDFSLSASIAIHPSLFELQMIFYTLDTFMGMCSSKAGGVGRERENIQMSKNIPFETKTWGGKRQTSKYFWLLVCFSDKKLRELFVTKAPLYWQVTYLSCICWLLILMFCPLDYSWPYVGMITNSTFIFIRIHISPSLLLDPINVFQ